MWQMALSVSPGSPPLPPVSHLPPQAIKPLVVHSFRSETHDLLCYQVSPPDSQRPSASTAAHLPCVGSPLQVFGFDFMMDDSFETWLIEINGQPAVAEVWVSFTGHCAFIDFVQIPP